MNFALILLILVLVTGVAWVADKLVFQPARRRAAQDAVSQFDQQQLALQGSGIQGSGAQEGNALASARAKLRDEKLRQPWWLEYSASFFPVILAVFVLRSFVVEPFKIPSGSMIPTLLVGDFILVNKFDYGIRLPVVNKKIIDLGEPKRGDVVVFRYPKDESMDYIKRVIGVPGDVVAYQNKKLTINGQPVPETALPDFFDDEHIAYFKQFEETVGGVKNRILNDPNVPPYIMGADDFPNKQNCQYNSQGVICKVPPGNYFMMGDNRDNSADSRYWGFVPEQNIVGRAFFIWMNFSNLKRLGSFQ
ncbi:MULTISPECIES: signal peptidase I [Pandoraea]|uniref:Signal peptidase I n=1 Tax=Pandoraea capi TaxID=2508286 RepID=A0ABY6VN37_9BURK|nr:MULTISPECIES: signal peptidase I [Pandoraea]MCI3204035.1 signal peptidase I [Pandoraea sp. LA3]MDN4582061.1 signal peptidase I [Pandoraea capi]VVD66582.1 signal peptidase [Pandoraea capi]